jgi:formylglycine-generating enzyme required for sulfatase activity
MDFTGAVKRQLIPLIRKHLETVQSVSTPRLVDEPVARLHKAPIDIEWIVIPKGEFLMGSEKESDRHAYDDEMPQHPLYLDEYIIAKYPVTNSQYQIFVHATNYQPPAHWRYGLVPGAQENHPVTNISWFDAIAFCNWLSRMLESTIRLPTEAEWEKAARGTDGRIWPWGNVPPTKDHCNYGSFFGSTTPVERYSKILGPYGAIGMAGNVWEWTMSLFMGYPYQLDDGRDDIGNDGQRTLRGGSWISNDALVRCACRDGGDPKVGDITTGFRIMCFCR